MRLIFFFFILFIGNTFTVSREKIKTLLEQIEQVSGALANNAKEKKIPTKVIFDKSSPSPWEVVFSERGFLIDDTRLSFEEIKNALSKNYSITLNGGNGLKLDAVKMQSILKYEDKNL